MKNCSKSNAYAEHKKQKLNYIDKVIPYTFRYMLK